MGKLYQYQCNSCKHEFEFTQGPIMAGHVAHCEDCGKEKLLAPDELLMELWGYHSFDYEWDPELSDNEPKLTTAVTGKCACGGNYSLNARPRCPKCRSDDINQDNSRIILID
ncbi:FmdB family zinc ribbon protein [Kangiella sp. M94]